ncbi:MAG: outer membrane beta-barrel protein, partial [Myxococcota bacterium]
PPPAEAPAEAPAPVPVEAPVEAPVPTTGIAVGRVLDPGGLPYPGLTFSLGPVSVTTDADGEFVVEVPAGDYAVALDQPGVFAPGDLLVTVAPGSRTAVEIRLQSDSPDDYVVMVYAPEVIGGVNASITEKRDSASVTEVIGAEQMTKSGDSSATSALARVTGLTVVDGRFVYVRGLGDRYSNTLLNLSSLPSPEPERRVVPLDLFPTGLLESVTIYKTWSPDLPAEFGGGTVVLKTRGIPERPYNQVTLTAGYSGQSTFTTADTGYRSPTDWLGFGTGGRALPGPLDAATRNGQLVEEDRFTDGLTPEELETIGESIDPSRWAVDPTTVPPDLGVQLGFGRRLDLGGARVGVFAGLTYQNLWSVDTYAQSWFANSDAGLVLANAYEFEDLENQILLGAIGNLGVELTEHHGLYYTVFLSRSSTYTARNYQGFNKDLGGELRVTRLEWVERQLLFQQLRGEHVFPALAELGVQWRYALSAATRDQPDLREFRYDLEQDTGEYFISDRPEGNNVLYSELADTNHDLRLDLSVPLGSDQRGGRLAVGAQAVRRSRGADTRRFSFFERGAIDDATALLPPEELFGADHIGVDGYLPKEVTRQSDSYDAGQQIDAAYALADFPFDVVAHSVWGLRDLSLLAGVRVERSAQQVTTFQLFAPDPTETTARLENTDVLPSVTVTQSLLAPPEDPNDDAMQVRFGWSRTVSRPDFRELSPISFNEVTGGREVVGNPDLTRALIDHVDFRWEWYPRQGETVSLGAFYKGFTDPIETVVVPSAQLGTTWANADGATNVGIEADLRKTLFGTGLGLLDRMYVSANGSLIRSRIVLPEGQGVQTNDDRPLQGQSPWVLNAQVGYDDAESKLIATVSFNVQGPRIVEVGALGVPDSVEDPVPTLDVLLQQGLPRDLYVRLRGRNLLDPVARIRQGDAIVRGGRLGRSVLLSVEWRP